MPQLTNSTKQLTQLQLEARKSFALGLWFKVMDLADRPSIVDIAGSTITFVMAKLDYQGGDIVVNQAFDLTDPTVGYARLNLQADDLNLDPGEYDFSVTFLSAQNFNVVVLKGTVEILANTNLDDGNTYTDGNPPASLTAFFQQNHTVIVSVNQITADDSLSIGTVTTVGYGSPAGASISGHYPNQLLDLTIPGGQPGSQGVPGDDGEDGEDGAPGVRGSRWYSGYGLPGTIAGSNPGDQYIDLATGYIYELS